MILSKSNHVINLSHSEDKHIFAMTDIKFINTSHWNGKLMVHLINGDIVEGKKVTFVNGYVHIHKMFFSE